MRKLLSVGLLFFVAVIKLTAQNCSGNATGNMPIPDLGTQQFNGFMGGKYPQGQNQIPASHYDIGLLNHEKIQPLNKLGQADTVSGKIGMMVLGFSTAAMTGRFVRTFLELKQENPYLDFFIGAQGGRDIN